MNILLVNPPRSPENAIRKFAPPDAKPFIHKKLIGPPLGLLTVAAAVSHHSVTILDLKAEYDLYPDAPHYSEIVIAYCAQYKPAIVGITVIASEFDDSMAILAAVKQFNPTILTVAGGLHASLCPQDFASTKTDIVCVGPSAHTFAAIADAFVVGKSLPDIPGTITVSQDKLIPSKLSPVVKDVAGKDYLRPRRDLIQKWLPAYLAPGGGNKKLTYLFTSLGCPFKCSFCSIWPQWDGRYYLRDAESIVAELASLTEYDVVRFADANSVIDVSFANILFDRIAESGIAKEYVMDIRADTAANNPKLIEKMARAGLRVVICGFESFRASELSGFNKQLDANLIGKAIEVFHDNGIMVRGNYVIPPDYAADDFDALTEFAAAQPTNYAGYTILTPMPGTPLHATMRNEIIDNNLRKYNFFNCVCKTKLSLDEFHRRVGSLWLIRKGNNVI